MAKPEKQNVTEYKVLTPVKYNDKIHRKGAKLKFTEAEAAPLLRHKAIEKAAPEPAEAAN
jgi:hypothetical protein